MKTISLTQNKIALVDDEDFEFLSQWKWHVMSRGYAARTTPDKGKILMHREIAKTPHGLDTDHVNRNKLDNRRVNLRICSHRDNLLNRSFRKPAGCITWRPQTQKWLARVQVKNKKIYLGYHASKQAAEDAIKRVTLMVEA